MLLIAVQENFDAFVVIVRSMTDWQYFEGCFPGFAKKDINAATVGRMTYYHITKCW